MRLQALRQLVAKRLCAEGFAVRHETRKVGGGYTLCEETFESVGDKLRCLVSTHIVEHHHSREDNA